MARTAKQNSDRSAACHEYRKSVGDECEIGRLERRLKKTLVEPDDLGWITRNRAMGVEVHHITARSNNPLKESTPNLIVVSTRVHDWIERHAPARGEILSLYCKFRKWQHRREIGIIDSPDVADWNVPLMDGLVSPHVSLKGHIEVLMTKCRGTCYIGYAESLLKAIEGSK